MFKPLDVSNPADPLKPPRSDHGRELFEKITQVANGFSYDDVINAATNLIVNAVRQSNDTSRKAEATFEEIMGKTKLMLIEQHYDAATGKRKSVFAHHQVIQAPFVEKKTLRGQ
jgi:hypothetical protein